MPTVGIIAVALYLLAGIVDISPPAIGSSSSEAND
jgi:hypothetical protein